MRMYPHRLNELRQLASDTSRAAPMAAAWDPLIELAECIYDRDAHLSHFYEAHKAAEDNVLLYVAVLMEQLRRVDEAKHMLNEAGRKRPKS